MAILSIPVTKGKASVEINTNTIPEGMYAAALAAGLKVLINGGASKITKEAYPDAEEMKTAAMAKAQERVEAINAGTLKIPGTKAAKSGVSGAVMTEAMRLARNLVKDTIKKAGHKISHYEASEITKAAKALLADDPSLIETAKANLDARSEIKVGIKITDIIKESPALVAKAEAKKAEKKTTLSAKQAGKVQPHAKKSGGQASTAQH